MSIRQKRKAKFPRTAFFLGIFLIYLILLFLLLIFKWVPFLHDLSELRLKPLPLTDQEPVNTHLLRSIRLDMQAISQAEYRLSSALNLWGNIFIFIPFGLLMPLFLPNELVYLRTILTGFLFILIIELIQLLFSIGVWDIDDIFLNLCGLIIGVILSLPLRKKLKR